MEEEVEKRIRGGDKCANEKPTLFDIRRLASTVYSGPTIFDVENALFDTTNSTMNARPSNVTARKPVSERKILNKKESEYTKTVMSNRDAHDGFKWRKYGQKSIKNNPNPRSYYRCKHPKCGAKKQVQASMEDPQTLVTTYHGLHIHFAYPVNLHLFLEQANSPPPKKPKIGQAQHILGQDLMGLAQKSPTSYGSSPFLQMGLLEDMVKNPSSC